jgi:phospho-N-acetylmuramoyl-pentapeptide-transferase
MYEWLARAGIKFPGSGLFQFITFRMLLAVLLSLFITTVYGKRLIRYLLKKQVGETVRDLGLAGEQQKKGTPTMGGIIILLAIIIPTLLFGNLEKVYVRLMLLSTVWLGIIGFIDDYLKLRAKRIAKEKGVDYKKTDSDGLAGRFKIFGQVVLGIIVGATLYFNSTVTVEREILSEKAGENLHVGERKINEITRTINGKDHRFAIVQTPITTIPFVRTHEFNYSRLLPRR